MARRMATSRAQLDRLLDPSNTSVAMHALQRAAAAVGRHLRSELVLTAGRSLNVSQDTLTRSRSRQLGPRFTARSLSRQFTCCQSSLIQ